MPDPTITTGATPSDPTTPPASGGGAFALPDGFSYTKPTTSDPTTAGVSYETMATPQGPAYRVSTGAGTPPASAFPAPAAPTQKPSEPTVLSSGNIADKVIPQDKEDLAKLQQKGTYAGEDGNTYYSDGTLAWSGQVGPEGAPGIDNQENDPGIAELNKTLGGMKAISDASTKQSLDAVHQMYGNRISMQNDLNARESQSREGKLLNSGTSRYAPLSASSIMTADERAHAANISNWEAKENTAIAKVNAAQQKGDLQSMNIALKEANRIRAEKQKATDKLQAAVQKNNDKIAAQHLGMLRGQAIAESVGRGNTDPAAIMKELNSNADGSDNGNNFTLKEVHAAFLDLAPKNTSTSDTYKFNNSSIGKLMMQGLPPEKIQGIADDLNGRGDGSTLQSLTPSQNAALNNILAPQRSSATKPIKSGSLTYTQDTLGKTEKWLKATKGPDNYVNPDAYKQAFDTWTGSGGLAKDFLAKFPPKNYVNPANGDLPKYLQSKTSTKGAAAGDVTSQINDLFKK